MKYNKLVRDKIPQIITDNGEDPMSHIADDVEYWSKLKEKLQEETREVVEDTDVLEELADLLEVIHAMLDFKNISIDELENIRLIKKAKRGGFKKRIILEKVE